MSTAETESLLTPATQRTLWRAAVYEVLALAFGYPDEETFADLEAALEALREHPVTASSDEREAIDDLAAAVAATKPVAAAVEHNRLFAGEVACATSETDHEFDAFAKARQLADIAGFYRAFGLRVASDRPGPADAIETELEFMAQAAMREAYSAAQGWDEKRDVCADAQRAFLEDHLGRWAANFCRSVVGQGGVDGLYAAAAALCDQFLRTEIQATGVQPRPMNGRRALAEDTAPFTCMFASPDEDDKEDQP